MYIIYSFNVCFLYICYVLIFRLYFYKIAFSYNELVEKSSIYLEHL